MADYQRFCFITHEEKTILCLDFSGTSPEEKTLCLPLIEEAIKNFPEKTLLIFENLTDSHFNAASFEAVKVFWSKHKQKIVKIASIGLSPLQLVTEPELEKFCGFPIMAFDCKEKALDWLVE